VWGQSRQLKTTKTVDSMYKRERYSIGKEEGIIPE
jgi:hypothetical protein